MRAAPVQAPARCWHARAPERRGRPRSSHHYRARRLREAGPDVHAPGTCARVRARAVEGDTRPVRRDAAVRRQRVRGMHRGHREILLRVVVSKRPRSLVMSDRTQLGGPVRGHGDVALWSVRADTGLCVSTVGRTNGDLELVDAGDALVGRSIAQQFQGSGWYGGKVLRYDRKQDIYEVHVRARAA